MEKRSSNFQSVKDAISLLLMFGVGIGLPIFIFYVRSLYFENATYIDPFLHFVLMLGVAIFGGTLAFVTYRAWKFYADPYLYVFSLFLSANALSSIAYGFAGILRPEISANITLYLSFFVLLPLFFPRKTISALCERSPIKVYIAAMATALVSLVGIAVLLDTLSLFSEQLTKSYTPLLGIIPSIGGLVFWMQHIRNKDSLYFSIAFALILWGGVSIAPPSSSAGDVLWWYFHATIFATFIIVLLGIVRRDVDATSFKAPFTMFSGIGMKVIFGFSLAILFFSILASITYSLGVGDIQAQTLRNLRRIVHITEKSTLFVLDALRMRTIDFSSDGRIRMLSSEILAGKESAVQKLVAHLKENKLVLDKRIADASVLGLDGVVIASTDEKKIGTVVEENKDLFTEISGSPYGTVNMSAPLYTTEHGSRQAFVLAIAPLFDVERKSRIGSIIHRISLDTIGQVLEEDSIQQNTFIVSAKDNRLLAGQSENRVPFLSRITSAPVQACQRGAKEYTGVYLNDLGVEVSGFARCLPNGWIALSEISLTESMGGISSISRVFVIGIIIALLATLLLGYYITRTIIAPLQKMSVFANEIASGHHEKRINHFKPDEIGLLGQNLNNMADKVEKSIYELKELDRSKSEFITIASHQLGTPLSILRWQIELLLQGTFGAANTKMRESFATLSHAADRMNSLIAELLDASRIEQKRIAYEPSTVFLCDLVKTVASEFEKPLKDKSLTLSILCEPDVLPSIRADKEKLRQGLANLISNAIRFNKNGGTIRIRAGVEENKIVMTIQDSGIGIPKKDHDKVFSKFFRASNAPSLVEGTGLGLFIAKQFIEGQGGTLSFESEENKGTTFTITLPYT